MFRDIAIFLTVSLFAFISYYFFLIGKYFRLKSGNGPKFSHYLVTGFFFLAGQLLSLSVFPNLVSRYISPALVVLGALGLIILSLRLYTSMMSINRTGGPK